MRARFSAGRHGTAVLALVAVFGLAVDGYVHLRLGPLYPVGTQVNEGTLFSGRGGAGRGGSAHQSWRLATPWRCSCPAMSTSRALGSLSGHVRPAAVGQGGRHACNGGHDLRLAIGETVRTAEEATVAVTTSRGALAVRRVAPRDDLAGRLSAERASGAPACVSAGIGLPCGPLTQSETGTTRREQLANQSRFATTAANPTGPPAGPSAATTDGVLSCARFSRCPPHLLCRWF